jgi:predicted lipoprotein with Yx(FWY)xxD motif
MRSRLVGGVIAGLLLLAACGDDDASTGTDPGDGTVADDGGATDDAAPYDAGEEGGTAPAEAGETSLGATLVDADGLTLYGFLPDGDAGGEPTCVDACADAWPPVIVDSEALPEGLDPAVFSVVERPDGSFQLAAGDWPLYLFANDEAAGDVNGQGLNDVWFAVAPDGSLVGAP